MLQKRKNRTTYVSNNFAVCLKENLLNDVETLGLDVFISGDKKTFLEFTLQMNEFSFALDSSFLWKLFINLKLLVDHLFTTLHVEDC